MSKVQCDVSECELEGDNGRDVDGVVATCSRCGAREESFGTTESSIKRCLAKLRESCPRGERNYYERR